MGVVDAMHAQTLADGHRKRIHRQTDANEKYLDESHEKALGHGVRFGRLTFGPVHVHELALELLHRGRYPGDGIRAGVDCAPDGGGVLAATRDDGNLREALAHFPDDRRRVLAGGDVDHLGAGHDLGGDELVEGHDRENDRDVDARGNLAHVLDARGRIDDDAIGTLHLGLDGHRLRTRARRGRASDAREDRTTRSRHEPLRDDGLAGEGIHGEHGICIAVADDGQIRREDEGLDATSEERDARTGIDLPGNVQRRGSMTIRAVDGLGVTARDDGIEVHDVRRGGGRAPVIAGAHALEGANLVKWRFALHRQS